MEKKVIITGAGILSAVGRGLVDTKQALMNAKSGIAVIESFSTENYTIKLGGEVANSLLDKDCFKKNKGDYYGRASYLVLTACKDALNSANLPINREDVIKGTIFIGTTLGGMLSGQQFQRDVLLNQNKGKRTFVLKDHLAINQADHIRKAFNIRGDAVVLNNACTSGLSAIGLAYKKIKSGEIDLAIAGGYDVMSDFTFAGFNSLRLITDDICRPFDKNRSGLLLGEGAGIVIIESLEHAKKRNAPLIAEIIGFGQTTDAYHITKPNPEANQASGAIVQAINDAKIKPEDIKYVNAHGTGTLANDLMETKALQSALGEYAAEVPISSTKPVTGHALGASGAIEVIISLIALNSNILPVNLNFMTPDPECNLNIIRTSESKKNINVVLSNSFGFGGSNASILIRKIRDE